MIKYKATLPMLDAGGLDVAVVVGATLGAGSPGWKQVSKCKLIIKEIGSRLVEVGIPDALVCRSRSPLGSHEPHHCVLRPQKPQWHLVLRHPTELPLLP